MISVSSIPVKEADFFGDPVVLAVFFPFLFCHVLSCSVARSGRTGRKGYKIPGTISKYCKKELTSHAFALITTILNNMSTRSVSSSSCIIT